MNRDHANAANNAPVFRGTYGSFLLSSLNPVLEAYPWVLSNLEVSMGLSLGHLLGSVEGSSVANQVASQESPTEQTLGAALLWFECILQKLTGYKLNHKSLSK